jgi:formamidopyrimidine-DNA glycosylase
MPELPDITVYVERLAAKAQGAVLQKLVIGNPFLLRTVEPPIASVQGRTVTSVQRLAKRVVLGFESELDGDLFLVIHLMVAGRLLWQPLGSKTSKIALARLEFSNGGQLVLTEAGSKRRASLHLVAGQAGLRALDPGGIEPLQCDLAAFSAQLTRANHTLKRVLTDPHTFSGIGNSYSDEILHRARLSPLALSQHLPAEDIARLHHAVQEVLAQWTQRLRDEAGEFPAKVTAFRDDFAVHGRFGQPCPVCAAPVQRIVYADNETNYCARCQTGGKVLADRALSRLLKASWPRNIDELG